MKVVKVSRGDCGKTMVKDCKVSQGYVLTSHASMPDVDIDFDADRREEVKHYLESRYNLNFQSRVFSAGALTTIKIKSAMKDVASVYKIPRATVNYLTQTIDDDELTWTGLMRLAATDSQLRKFIQNNPQVFEEMLPILGQGRSCTIHPSATIVTPEFVDGERLNCYEMLPVKVQNDMLVSELDGVEVEAVGILKNDILAIRELTRLSDMFALIKKEYGIEYTMLQITSKFLDDPKVFEIIKAGNTQGLFQMSSDGITKFIKRLRPDNINDLIAAVALFRPGPLDSGATDNYVRAKRGEYEPEYLWGTYDILKNTYGQMCYQEQISRVAQSVGSLSLGDGVNLVKALSKKKLEKVRKFKDKFFKGAEKNGCPIDAANQIWSNVEDAAKYSFNASHATAYGLTAYVGAWLKTYYPTAFYSVVLKDQDEDKMPALMNEMEGISGIELLKPDINISRENFVADFKHNRIYWSLSRVKHLGMKAALHIVKERDLYGDFYDLEDFIVRIFKRKFKKDEVADSENDSRCPVTSRSVKQLIFAGAFDRCEKTGSVLERYGLLVKASQMLKFDLTEKEVPEEMKDKHYFWSRMQIAVSGLGAIDYKRIYDNMPKNDSMKNVRYIAFSELNNPFFDVRKGVVCATVTGVVEKSYKDKRTGENKRFGKIELQQNTQTNILTIWDGWKEVKQDFKGAVGKMVAAVCNVRWSDYDEKNVLQINKVSFLRFV